jgi:hypothetical protein
MTAENATKPPIHVSNCTYCGSTNIARHVRVDQTADAGRIGLSYRTRFLVVGTEALYADLCDDCGSVLRIFVDKVGKQWVVK